MRTIYLDSNATTRPANEVIAAMDTALAEHWHNPSSGHRPGQAARHAVDLARESVARLLGCRDRDIIFTSGGTEADNLAILGSLAAQPGRNVIVTGRTEHEAIRDCAEVAAGRGAELIWLEVDQHGVIDCNALEDALTSRADDIALVTIMWANNETGVIQPIETIGNLCREHGVRFHTDAVQWVGKMPTKLDEMPIDLMSFSGHKFHGPKGAGGLFAGSGVRLEKRSIGGSQERERRGGTENTPGIAGLGAAADLAAAWLETDERDRLSTLRDRFETTILDTIDDVTINSSGAVRMWNTSNIAFKRLEAEAILMLLSERGVCASAGAACSTGSLEPSPVLTAMKIDPVFAHGAVRFSLSRFSTEDEIDEALAIVPEVIAKLRRSMASV